MSNRQLCDVQPRAEIWVLTAPNRGIGLDHQTKERTSDGKDYAWSEQILLYKRAPPRLTPKPERGGDGNRAPDPAPESQSGDPDSAPPRLGTDTGDDSMEHDDGNGPPRIAADDPPVDNPPSAQSNSRQPPQPAQKMTEAKDTRDASRVNSMPTFIGYINIPPFRQPDLALAKSLAKNFYIRQVKGKCRRQEGSKNPELVAALVVPSKGVFYSSIPDGPALGWLRQNGQSLAPLHDGASGGRGNGNGGIWHAEDSAAYQYEKAFRPPGPAYPPGSYMAVYGRMASTTKTNKLLTQEQDQRELTQEEVEDSTERDRPPCRTAARDMPAGQECVAVLSRLGIGYDENLRK